MTSSSSCSKSTTTILLLSLYFFLFFQSLKFQRILLLTDVFDCRLCNDIYLVLRAEVTGVLIGQSEAEVSEDVGEDQEHLTFIDQFHFPINRNLCSVIFVLPSAYFYCLLLHVYDFKGAQI